MDIDFLLLEKNQTLSFSEGISFSSWTEGEKLSYIPWHFV